MNRITFIVLCTGFLGFGVYAQLRFDRLESQLAELSKSVAGVKSKTAVVSEPEIKPVTPKIVAPSKNPAADITGASARAQSRKANRSDCYRACRQIISCISKKGLCDGLPTDGQESAVQLCGKSCEEQPNFKAQLLARTGCTENSITQVPKTLQSVCSP